AAYIFYISEMGRHVGIGMMTNLAPYFAGDINRFLQKHLYEKSLILIHASESVLKSTNPLCGLASKHEISWRWKMSADPLFVIKPQEVRWCDDGSGCDACF